MSNLTGNTEKCQDEHLKKHVEKKLKTVNFLEFMRDKGVKMDRLQQCGNFLSFQTNKNKTAFLLSGGNFCKNRFCPVCSWLKAKKTAFELLELLKVVELQEKKKFLFITLTAKNVPGNKLADEITDYNKAFKRLTDLKRIRSFNKGCIRKLEVTYNEKENTFHPHFHVIMAVNSSYFTSRDYLSKRKLLELWQQCKRDDSITQVDIKPVKMNSIYEIMEMATYSAKTSDLLQSQELFDVFYKALRGRQLLTFTEIFKEYKKKIEKGEIDLDEILELKALQEKAVSEILYQWQQHDKKYLETQERELPDHEQKSFYDLKIDID